MTTELLIRLPDATMSWICDAFCHMPGEGYFQCAELFGAPSEEDLASELPSNAMIVFPLLGGRMVSMITFRRNGQTLPVALLPESYEDASFGGLDRLDAELAKSSLQEAAEILSGKAPTGHEALTLTTTLLEHAERL